MTLPTVHINGTSKKELMAGYRAQLDALEKALDSMRWNSPNGRDYYPQGPDAINEAAKEHAARMQKVQSVYDEIHEMAMAL